jgi:hypothetical protein
MNGCKASGEYPIKVYTGDDSHALFYVCADHDEALRRWCVVEQAERTT